LITHPHEGLARIRVECETVLDTSKVALWAPLTADESESREDNPEAREKLMNASRAANILADHLDKNFDFVNEVAEPKEEQPCQG
jgi:hypothetical protein